MSLHIKDFFHMLALFAFISASSLIAQQNALPEAPQAKSSTSTDACADARCKFLYASSYAFAPTSLPVTGAVAAFKMSVNNTPAFGQGARGYGRYYWRSYVDQSVEAYMTRFVLPTALHQNPVYIRRGEGGAWRRSGYALSRVVIGRCDNGERMVNWSVLLGSAASTALSTTYYPSSERNASRAAQNWSLTLAGEGVSNLWDEFRPDLLRLFHHSRAPKKAPEAKQ